MRSMNAARVKATTCLVVGTERSSVNAMIRSSWPVAARSTKAE
jgi:hypothetical protein